MDGINNHPYGQRTRRLPERFRDGAEYCSDDEIILVEEDRDEYNFPEPHFDTASTICGLFEKVKP